MTIEAFEFSQGDSNKFWNIELSGCSFTVSFGRVGAKGQAQTKTFSTEAEARAAYQKSVDEKVSKGYVRVPGAAPLVVSSAQSNVVNVQFGAAAKGELQGEDDSGSANKSVATAERIPADACCDVGDDVHSNLSATAPPGEGRVESQARKGTIHLQQEDFKWCTWISRVVNLRRPEFAPFDRATALKRFEEMPNDGYKWLAAVRRKYGSPLKLSREDAEFWWRALDQFSQMPAARIYSDRENNPSTKQAKDKIHSYLQVVRLSGDITTADMDRLFNHACHQYSNEPLVDQLAFLLCAMCPPWDLIQYASGQQQELAYCIMHHFREQVMPYLLEKDVEFLRNWVRPQLVPSSWHAYHTRKSSVRTLYLVAAFLGLSEEIEALLATFPDGSTSSAAFPQALVLSLSSQQKVIDHGTRLNLSLVVVPRLSATKINPEEEFLRGWLAATGSDALDLVVNSIFKAYSKEEVERRFKVLALIDDAALVPAMVQLFDTAAAPLARTWLETRPWWSVPHLLSCCGGKKSKTSDIAREILQNLRHSVNTDDVGEEAVASLRTMFHSPEDDVPFMDDASTPEWLKTALSSHKTGKVQLPDWVAPSAVPPIIVAKCKMTVSQMEQLLGALKASSLDKPHSLVSTFKSNLDSRACERCVWWLFEKWLKAGAPSKEKWAMLALGLLGSDATALKLTPLIRQWPGESQHARAITGLECLRRIGTDTALMQINGIAQKVQFKGLKQKAMECMEYIAKERQLSRPELEDRIVPDCGLDERGQRVFDFGSRKYSFHLTSELKAVVKDEDGKQKTDLPKPNSKDDSEKAERAVQEWKLLKQQVKDIGKVQAIRLEQAMVTGRMWTTGDFMNLLVKHPFMINFVKLLVWGTFDMEGVLRRSFRVTEDQTFAGVDDRPLQLNDHDEIGIVHPLQLDSGQKTQWAEVLSDYDIVAPFPQLGRAVYCLDENELRQAEIVRFADKLVPAITIVSMLEKQGWQRGPVEDGGAFHEHTKYFARADLTAVACYDYIVVGAMLESHDQEIQTCFFEQGKSNSSYRDRKSMVPLEFIDSIVISEVLADLTMLTAKARE